MPRKRTPNLEKSLEELEKLVVQLEHGETSLEESLKLFEKGVTLTRHCQQALQEAEQKVDMLIGDKVESFSPLSPDLLKDQTAQDTDLTSTADDEIP